MFDQLRQVGLAENFDVVAQAFALFFHLVCSFLFLGGLALLFSPAALPSSVSTGPVLHRQRLQFASTGVGAIEAATPC